MRKIKVILIAGLVLLFSSGSVLAARYAPDGFRGKGKFTNHIKHAEFAKYAKIFRYVKRERPGKREVPKVPEPATMLVLGAGLLGLAIVAKKKIK